MVTNNPNSDTVRLGERLVFEDFGGRAGTCLLCAHRHLDPLRCPQPTVHVHDAVMIRTLRTERIHTEILTIIPILWLIVKISSDISI